MCKIRLLKFGKYSWIIISNRIVPQQFLVSHFHFFSSVESTQSMNLFRGVDSRSLHVDLFWFYLRIRKTHCYSAGTRCDGANNFRLVFSCIVFVIRIFLFMIGRQSLTTRVLAWSSSSCSRKTFTWRLYYVSCDDSRHLLIMFNFLSFSLFFCLHYT